MHLSTNVSGDDGVLLLFGGITVVMWVLIHCKLSNCMNYLFKILSLLT